MWYLIESQFALDGTGIEIANDEDTLIAAINRGLDLSPISKVSITRTRESTEPQPAVVNQTKEVHQSGGK